jgi:hypothetical protein
MQINRRTILLVFFILLVNVILAVIFRDWIRENLLIPILYLVWYVDIFLHSLGQTCLWPLLVALAGFIALRLMRSRKKQRQNARGSEYLQSRTEESRIAFWAKNIRRRMAGEASLGLSSHRLKELVISVLAYQENLTPQELEQELAMGRRKFPDSVLHLMKTEEEINRDSTDKKGFWNQLLGMLGLASNSSKLAGGAQLSEAVKFLEDQLEIKHDD